jgi:Protein of unknown function (DUF3313)
MRCASAGAVDLETIIRRRLPMFKFKSMATVALVFTLGTALAEDAPTNWDGLVEVKPRKMEAAYVLPGADFRPYTKVMLDPVEVAFRKDWMQNMNRDTPLSNQVTDRDAQKILDAARSNFDDIFQEAFTKAGYQVVTTAAPDVLRIRTGLLNLYINAPDLNAPGRSRSYTANAGEATLFIEVRDSVSVALLGRVVDRRQTRDTGMQMATGVSNQADFRMLFKQWASIAAKGMEELKSISPVPTELKPGQQL